MASGAPWCRWQDQHLFLTLYVQPRAKRDELCGPADRYLKVRITAPPVEGKANEHLRRFLAKQFGVPRSAVELEAGEHSRLKRVRIRAPQKIPHIIERLIR